MGEHPPVVAQHLAYLQGLLVLGLEGLLNFPLHHHADKQADDHQQPEDHPPVAVGADVAAHHGGYQWSERHHQDDEGHGAGKRILLEKIPQQGVDHHRARRAPAACSIRQASSSGSESAMAQPTEAMANIINPARITGLRPKLSASGP